MRRQKKPTASIILLASDLHIGERTCVPGLHDYNSFVASHRLDQLPAKLDEFKRDLSGLDVDELLIAFLGDVVDGVQIYPTQSHEQEITDASAQAERFAEITAPFIESAARIFKSVRVVGIVGNHGRKGRFRAETDSDDRQAYSCLKNELTHKRITFALGGDLLHRIERVKGKKILFHHGHDIKGSGSWQSIEKKVSAWHDQRIFGPKLGAFDICCIGHFHRLGHIEILSGSAAIFLNGTLVTGDMFAPRVMGQGSTCAWWAIAVSDAKQNAITSRRIALLD